MDDMIASFREFLGRVQLLKTLDTLPVTGFQKFIELAVPLAIGKLRADLEKVTPQLQKLRPWLTQFDILRQARIEYVEDSYTELVAWALDPGTHRASAARRQKRWLQSLKLPAAFDSPVKPMTQFSTGDGVPDLILGYKDFTVVVEAKTQSSEHAAPSGISQTLAYSEAVRRRLELPQPHPVYIVFLTLDGRRADNPHAISTTYAAFAVSMADALGDFEMPPDLRFAYSLIITHFVTCGLRDELERKLLLEVSMRPDGMDDDFLVSNASKLGAITKLVSGGES